MGDSFASFLDEEAAIMEQLGLGSENFELPAEMIFTGDVWNRMAWPGIRQGLIYAYRAGQAAASESR